MIRSAALDTSAGPDLGQLPIWDLGDLYPGTESPELKADLARMDVDAKAFHDVYAGRVAELDGDGLARAIAEYERIDEVLSRAMSYAGLVYSGNMADPDIGKFYQSAQERVNGISTHLVFFTLEINRLEEEALQARLRASKDLAHYASWVRDVRLYREHQLSDELERLLHEKHVVGRAAWNRLFDETIAGLRFPMGGKDLTCAEALNKLSDRDAAVRREAGEVVGRVLGDNARLFALITNTLAKDKEIEDKWRNYRTPVSSRNLSNRVEDEVVEALVAAVKQAYPDLSHRYYALKAKWFGQTHLDYWDRNAPLPDDADRTIRWDEARDLVLGAYGRFSPELAEYGKRFFDNAWIDAPVRPGKAPGAFAHPTVPSAHPYLLVNYQGKTRDVMTLAHELGHGVHQILAGRQGHLMSDTPLTLAETASVFGEMLTFRALVDAETDPKRRRIMLATKVEDMLNTVVRQIAFYDFETRVHNERREGELTPERIGEIWMAVQTDSLGPTLRFDENYRNYWAYIPHFVHSPFYVYAYAFGDCLVNSLYAVYQEADAGFAQRYLAMLEAGGTLRHKDLLAPFGLDASDPAFWQKGLDVIRGFIDELESAT
ncbi:M3 family oligoendopeptidase [Azospirillum sp. sgz301742]